MNNKIIGSIVIVVLIAGAIYFINKPGTQQTTSNQNNPTPTNTNTQNQPTDNTQANTAPKTVNISIKNFSFNPATLNIKKGDTVVWVNNDSVPHQIAGGSFQGNPMSNGQSFSFTFTSTGTFDYRCQIHPSMTGKIVVE